MDGQEVGRAMKGRGSMSVIDDRASGDKCRVGARAVSPSDVSKSVSERGPADGACTLMGEYVRGAYNNDGFVTLSTEWPSNPSAMSGSCSRSA